MSDNFREVRTKTRNVDPILFRDSFQQLRVSRIGTWMFLKRIWSKSKGTAIAFVFLTPIRLISDKLLERSFKKFEEIFKQNNEQLQKQLSKAKTRNRRIFLETWIELNDVAIEQINLHLEISQLGKDIRRIKQSFLQHSTTEKFNECLDLIEHLFKSREQFMKTLQKKADLQDKAVKYGKELTKFEKRDLEDFVRAILLDTIISSYERKTLFFQTPVEIMLKSNKIVNRIYGFFLLTPALRASAELLKEEQQKIANWLKNLSSAQMKGY